MKSWIFWTKCGYSIFELCPCRSVPNPEFHFAQVQHLFNLSTKSFFCQNIFPASLLAKPAPPYSAGPGPRNPSLGKPPLGSYLALQAKLLPVYFLLQAPLVFLMCFHHHSSLGVLIRA